MKDRQLLVDALTLICQLLPGHRYESEQRVVDQLRERISEIEEEEWQSKIQPKHS